MVDLLTILIDKSPYLAAAVICFGGFLWGMKIVFDWITGTNDAMREGIVTEVASIKAIAKDIQINSSHLQRNFERLFMENEDLKEHIEDVLKALKDIDSQNNTIIQKIIRIDTLINERALNRGGSHE